MARLLVSPLGRSFDRKVPALPYRKKSCECGKILASKCFGEEEKTP
jgi:hypothetical protein